MNTLNRILFFSLMFCANLIFSQESRGPDDSSIYFYENYNENAELDFKAGSCWFCILEDVVGALEGGALGSAGGPMGAAVGAAAGGAYRSYKEWEDHKDRARPINENFLDELAQNYELESGFENNDIGLKHNELLAALILNSDNLNSVEGIYNFLIGKIKQDPFFDGFTDDKKFKAGMLIYFKDGSISNSNYYNEIYDLENQSSLINNETEFLNRLNQLFKMYKGDRIATQALSTAYHTYYFWKNLN